MVTYAKNFYPELTESDFNEHIIPIANCIDSLSISDKKRLEGIIPPNNHEKYPYQNICKAIVKDIWERVWDTNLDQYIFAPNSFRDVLCEILAQQVVFPYLVRCFAEDIKSVTSTDENSEKNYRFYNELLIKNQLEMFSNHYPIAWGRCNYVLTNRITAICMMIQRIERNRDAIQEEFGIFDYSKIVSIEFGGDTHNNGSSVVVITFEKGNKLIYKPRSVSGEVGYRQLLSKISKFISLNLTAIRALNFGEYGFTSFIEVNNAKIKMYEAGQLACLMYLLNASDMHYSNILWTNNGPVPIDLETLFQPSRIRIGITESSKSAYYEMEKSVYGTGILPISLGKKNGDKGVDVGFTGIRNQNSSSPFKSFSITDGFSSKIKVTWKDDKIQNKLSKDKGLEKIILERSSQIVSGFTDFYRKIFDKKEQFIEAVIQSFANSEIRYIHNMTYRYMQVLRSLTDSEASKSIDIAHNLLARVGILSLTSDKNIVKSEAKQLWNGDVPYFSINFDETEIFCQKTGITKITKSPKSEFLLKIESMSEKNLETQIKLIKLAFVAKLADPHKEKMLETGDKSVKFNKADSEKIKEAIFWFAQTLSETILDDRYSHLPKTWLGPVSGFRELGWSPGVLGYDLYGGRVGPALSLAVAGKVLSEERFTQVSADIFDKSSKIFESKTFELRNVLLSGIGGFSGVSGLLWTLSHAGNVLNNEKWQETARESWKLLHNSLTIQDNFFDMIMGASSSIVMRNRIEAEFCLNNNLKEKIITLAEKKLQLMDKEMTSGLTHGLGQMLWYFSLDAQKTNNIESKKIAREILEIIESRYKNNNIIEIYQGNSQKISASWCNGTSGILIAYYEAFKAGVVEKEKIIDLIKQLKKQAIPTVPVLCHGSLGVYGSLQYIGESFSDYTSAFLEELERSYCSPSYILDYYKNEEGRYPLSPGLMSGQAGALLYLCKLVDSTIDINPLTLK